MYWFVGCMYIGPVVSVMYTIDQKACTSSKPVYESLHKDVFLVERLDLECLLSWRRRNEYQQFVGQPELQNTGY